jgi:hypothetical protein
MSILGGGRPSMSDKKRLFMGAIIVLLTIIICSGLGTVLVAMVATADPGY